MSPTPDFSANHFTRRRILGWTSAGAIGGLAGYWCWPSGKSERASGLTTVSEKPALTKPPESPPDSLSSEAPAPAGGLRREDFLPHLKSVFQLDSDIRCTLVEVGAARKMVGPTAGFTSFSLLFAAPIEFAGEGKIYHLTHGKMGAMDLFLTPVGRSKDQVNLEAVFSQRV
jgi:hypothetical protein